MSNEQDSRAPQAGADVRERALKSALELYREQEKFQCRGACNSEAGCFFLGYCPHDVELIERHITSALVSYGEQVREECAAKAERHLHTPKYIAAAIRSRKEKTDV